MVNAHAPIPEVEVATPAETRADLLGRQRRPGTPIRSALLQERGGSRAPGPLHEFVRERRLFALHLYLLLHCIARAAPWDVWLPAGVWARALDKTGVSGEAAVSRSWRWLKDARLVRTERDRRVVRAFLLKEDGSGDPYDRSRDYFTLPLAFFLDEWYAKLDLAATATLLIALDRSRKQSQFELRKEPTARWVGISADTLQRGLDQLREHGVLEVEQRPVKDTRARHGWTPVNFYRLLGPFERRGGTDPSHDHDRPVRDEI